MTVWGVGAAALTSSVACAKVGGVHPDHCCLMGVEQPLGGVPWTAPHDPLGPEVPERWGRVGC